ncbi:hypothetical protein EXIGLDRAFT_746949 [Exidia glandulosa HHB12029]|uniref:Uncharacterized protein n=1 Tax=Exidia glandulosa HHB12029 TaxID=1314781 RepID=A0A165LFX4_EXIGL|nr:hypothetical protein EXIGLDRAFT_746949 [Exidia glandulosa HHB12029]
MATASLAASTPTPTGYLQIACTSWFLYDWVLTLDDETPYYAAAEEYGRSNTFGCEVFSWVLAIATAVVVVEVDIVLQLRVYAIYEKSRRILFLNGALCIANVVSSAVILAELFSQTHPVTVPVWIQGTCYGLRSKVLGTVWVAPLCYDLYLTLLSVYKLVQDYWRYGRMGGHSLLSVLARDSVVYFFLLVVVVALNIAFWTATPITPGDSTVNLIHAAGGVGGARIILNMREAALRQPSGLDSGGLRE